jgi:NAD dependent epimerase/dehydratase
MLNNKKSDKLVLVTGGDGFIGSHLVEDLLHRGYRVRALTQYNSFNYWGWLEDIPENKNLTVVTGDIRDPYLCKEITKDIDLIFHLAALIAIPYSYIAPDSYLETNVKGTLNICQAAKENGNIRILCTSTSEVYGTAQYVPIDEKHPKQPQSPYSASKIAADAIALSYYNSFDLPLTIVRPFNTYGPRQSARAIIPSVIIQIANGMNEIKLGNLTPTRDFNFVKDTCAGFIAIAESEACIGKEINLCSGSEESMSVIVNAIKEIMKSDIKIITENGRLRPENSEVYRLLGDNKLVMELTGFTSHFSLRQGLELTCDWFRQKENLKKYKAGIYNL